MTEICVSCIVSGKVQGVFFRASAQDEALKLGLTGWIKNLSDGNVQAFVCGAEPKVNQLLAWMARGPEMADVDDVTHKVVGYENHLEFNVRY